MATGFQTDAVSMELARGAAYGLLAEGFRYPEAPAWRRLHDRSRWAGWPERLADGEPTVRGPLRQVQERLFSPDPERGGVTLETAQATHARLFGHAVKGPCPMYELEFGAGEIFQRSAELSDLKGFYEAFGLVPSGQEHERPDHLSVQMEFLAILSAKEAYAEEQGNAEAAEILREAHRKFLEDHLGQWLPSFARRVSEAAPGSVYAALAEFARAFVTTECARFDAQPGPATLELRPASERDETIQNCAIEDFGGACPMHADET